MVARKLEISPIHLGLGARAEVEPDFTGEMAWYQAYGARHANDGAEGRLVSWYSFSESWTSWEMHPNGDEVVLCVSGEITLMQQRPDGVCDSITLQAGDYAINAPGVWHTADVKTHAACVFITAGEGTEHRSRD